MLVLAQASAHFVCLSVHATAAGNHHTQRPACETRPGEAAGAAGISCIWLDTRDCLDSASSAASHAVAVQKYWAGNSKRPHRFMNVLMLEQAFKKTEQWRQIEAELAQPFDPALADPRSLATKK